MKYVKDGDSYFIRLEKGEEVFASLEKFASDENLKSGHLSGIGALTDAELGAYLLEKKEYKREIFSDIYELLTLEGNLSYVDDKPFFHIHTVLGDHNFQTFGGHLFKATVAVTCEIHFKKFNSEVIREMNDEVGLKLLEFCGIK